MSFVCRHGRRPGRSDGRERRRRRGRGRVRSAHGERGCAVPRRRAAVGHGVCAAALPLPAAAASALRGSSQPLHAASGKLTSSINKLARPGSHLYH